MESVKIKSGEWVVVCDGRKALILENEGDAVFPNLRTKETHEHDDAKTSEQGTDRPGRVHDAASAGRSSVEQTRLARARRRQSSCKASPAAWTRRSARTKRIR